MQCAAHADMEAFHQCTLCGAWHCEACLKPIETQGSARPIQTCPSCGGLARVAIERVAEERADLRDVVLRPFSGDGALTILALGAPLGLTVIPMRLLSLFFAFVYLGCLAGYYFQTVDHIGRGR